MSINPINNLNACDPSSQASMNAGAMGASQAAMPKDFFSQMVQDMLKPPSSNISGIGAMPIEKSEISGINTNEPLPNNNLINSNAAVTAITLTAPLDPTVSSIESNKISGIQTIA
jgi:hypothetical protein